MAIYRIRLEDPNSDEFRLVAVAAESEEEAKEICLAQEYRHVHFLVGEGELTELEAKEAEGTLTGREKARLYSHRQADAYVVVDMDGEES